METQDGCGRTACSGRISLTEPVTHCPQQALLFYFASFVYVSDTAYFCAWEASKELVIYFFYAILLPGSNSAGNPFFPAVLFPGGVEMEAAEE